ncbi:MAG: hypothetical protein CL910_09210 [Deltaproteobacteria bacterium]|nr:hypothetical protein [Deltaproteobacteria bacterium]
MTLELRLAWRNIGRNLRRTGLTVAATVFAVFLVILSVTLQHGVHEKMVEDAVRVLSGHVQVSGEDYLDQRTLEQYVEVGPELLERLEATRGVVGVAPRVVGFGLVSKGSSTNGVAVFGVDPEREGRVSTLPTRMVEGEFLAPGGQGGILLGGRLANNLGARLGDELLLYSVAYSLETAYELYTVQGILRLPEPALDRTLVLLSLQDAQTFFAYGNKVSEVALLADHAGEVGPILAELAGGVRGSDGAALAVHSWNEVMPELEQFIFLDDAGAYIILFILVVVVAFGILNTILMSVLERVRELGVMLALGLKPGSIFRVVYLESMMLAGLGLLIGLVLAIPTALHLEQNPIPMGEEMAGVAELVAMDPVVTFVLHPSTPIGAALVILFVAALAALYPAIKASRSRPVDALRSL